jgi:hypothetical protein
LDRLVDAPPDHGTGLDSATVDEVLGYLWKTDLIDGVMGSEIEPFAR